MNTLQIKNVHVSIQDKEILKGISLEVKEGEIVALMGPNGSGKSTLGNTIMGNPNYELTKGEILFNKENISSMNVDERARKGIFLSFQQPIEIPGLVIKDFLKQILEKKTGEKQSIVSFNKLLRKEMKTLGIDSCFADRALNEGFSGGEKKRMEMLQLSLIKPKIAILDETDSGLDVDAIKYVVECAKRLQKEHNMSILVISHYKRMLDELEANRVIVLQDGFIKHEGGREVIEKLEAEGYTWLDKGKISCNQCALKGRSCPHNISK